MTGIDLYDGITLHQGDCRDIMRTYPDQHFDAVITDPPYGISFEGEKWDAATPHGFQAWAQSWGEEALRVIKPGGYMLAFSAARTYHRLTSGLEDAGFEIRDAMAWIRADGKPNGMDIASAFDRDAGVLDQREGREIERWDTSAAATTISTYKTNATGEPITDEAKAWEGWGVGLKPAWEPIVVARRPLEGRLIDNVREHGTGAMNIRAGQGRGQRLVSAEPAHGRGSHGRRRGTGRARPRVARIPIPAQGPHKRAPEGGGVQHVTVKPLELMRYLIRLVVRPGSLFLEPFAGSGTTLQAAAMENTRAVGCELDDRYIPLIKARFAQGIEAPLDLFGLDGDAA